MATAVLDGVSYAPAAGAIGMHVTGVELDTAIAHHHGADALPCRWLHCLVLGDLAVVMRMDVDPGWCHHRSAGIDHLVCRFADRAAYCGNPSVCH